MRRDTTVMEDRKTWQYRVLEQSLAFSTIGYIILFIIISWLFPVAISLFLLGYALLWIFKIALNIQYTLQSYKQFHRSRDIDLPLLFHNFHDSAFVSHYLHEIRGKYNGYLGWYTQCTRHITQYEHIINTPSEHKFLKPFDITHCAVFSVYNEGVEVIEKSLTCVYNAKWPLNSLVVTIAQEGRLGDEKNDVLIAALSQHTWIELYNIDELLKHDTPPKLSHNPHTIKVCYTRHPDGLEGEIKGKASNETWATKQTFAYLEKAYSVDFDMVLATSLDADSHVAPFFFHNVTYAYIFAENRFQSGFQPVHIYSNNFFQTGIIPRLVATQTTMYNLTNLSLPDEAFLFAIYTVPARVLREVNYWVTDIIAEDSLLFSKCLTHYNGNFKVHPHWGVFEGDAVEAQDYIQELINQYKQLQRWSWGGVEGFPYLFKRLWLTPESSRIPLHVKIKWTYLKFANHFFWVTAPFTFSVGPFIPAYIHSQSFSSMPIAQNLSIMSQNFAWVSFIFIIVFAYLTFNFQAKSAKKGEDFHISEIIALVIQFAISPMLFGVMAIPAIDAQIRGFLGKYMGYWVTPKK